MADDVIRATFTDEVVTVWRLIAARTPPSIDGKSFSNCRIIGPAILVPMGQTSFNHCSWEGDLDSIFWEITPGRETVMGVVGVIDCTFANCSFVAIGVAGPPRLRTMLERGFS